MIESDLAATSIKFKGRYPSCFTTFSKFDCENNWVSCSNIVRSKLFRSSLQDAASFSVRRCLLDFLFLIDAGGDDATVDEGNIVDVSIKLAMYSGLVEWSVMLAIMFSGLDRCHRRSIYLPSTTYHI